MPADLRISHPQLVRLIRQALADAGIPPHISDIEAEITAEADLLGVPSHGVRMLPGLLRGIREGRVNPNPNLKILRERAATCLLDGDHGPGRYVSVEAMRHAIERAKTSGIG